MKHLPAVCCSHVIAGNIRICRLQRFHQLSTLIFTIFFRLSVIFVFDMEILSSNQIYTTLWIESYFTFSSFDFFSIRSEIFSHILYFAFKINILSCSNKFLTYERINSFSYCFIRHFLNYAAFDVDLTVRNFLVSLYHRYVLYMSWHFVEVSVVLLYWVLFGICWSDLHIWYL